MKKTQNLVHSSTISLPDAKVVPIASSDITSNADSSVLLCSCGVELAFFGRFSLHQAQKQQLATQRKLLLLSLAIHEVSWGGTTDSKKPLELLPFRIQRLLLRAHVSTPKKKRSRPVF